MCPLVISAVCFMRMLSGKQACPMVGKRIALASIKSDEIDGGRYEKTATGIGQDS